MDGADSQEVSRAVISPDIRKCYRENSGWGRLHRSLELQGIVPDAVQSVRAKVKDSSSVCLMACGHFLCRVGESRFTLMSMQNRVHSYIIY